MKKYPITYKNKEYEVRWEEGSLLGKHFYDHITVYEVKKILKNYKYYKEVYSVNENYLMDYLSSIHIYKDNPNYYIEEIKCLFNLMEYDASKKEKANKEKYTKEKALEEWNGILEEKDGVIDVNYKSANTIIPERGIDIKTTDGFGRFEEDFYAIPGTMFIENMRDATPEEQKSIHGYIDKISKPTGVNFWDPIEALDKDFIEDKIGEYKNTLSFMKEKGII